MASHTSKSTQDPRAQRLGLERNGKRVRVVAGGKTIADSLATMLVLEHGHMPVYYFPRADVRMDLLEKSEQRSRCPLKGEASYWTVNVAGRRLENAVWSYEQPLDPAAPLTEFIAFYWDKIDHWFEEDEEVFGHPRDPNHRIDVRPSSRVVRVLFSDQQIAYSRRAMFLFETGLPVRYYIPPQDVLASALTASPTRTTCPYKGQASYYSLTGGGQIAEDAVWSYREPLPECPRIREYLCFDPRKVQRIEVEGEPGAM